jgi:hypothetical protein
MPHTDPTVERTIIRLMFHNPPGACTTSSDGVGDTEIRQKEEDKEERTTTNLPDVGFQPGF